MIKTLRRKFIAITMYSIVLVLGSIIGLINLANYYNINQRANELLAVLAENNGAFPKPAGAHNEKKREPHGLSPEAPFNTRYFTVLLRSDGTVVSVDTGRIAAVSTGTATDYAVALQKQGKTSGFRGNYKYRMVSSQENSMYIFLDCSQELSTFYFFLFMSVLVSLAGILLVFALVLFFSKRAVKPIAESYEKQKQFITDASHEMKTPLTIIDANTEVLEMEKGENEWTGSIKNQVKRLTEFTEKLVFLSRMDEEQAALHWTDFSLSDAVSEAAQPFEAMAAARGRTLRQIVEPQISYYGDEAALRELVSLLLENAVKYSDENGAITLRLRTVGKKKELTVQNTVSEIQPGNLDRLFERFYRLDSSRNSETGGHGIGLSVAKAIAAAHKGKISANSEDGKSVVFKVIL